MKRSKKIVLIIVLVIGVFFLFSVWYKYEYAMDEAKMYQIHSSDLNRKLLIATQGSTFKDSITNSIVNHYTSDSIFIKVLDISALTDVDPQNYTAILLIHTWENWKPPFMVRQFVERISNHADKLVVLTTSGGGTFQMTEVDALTGESKLEEVQSFVDKIIYRLESILNNQDL